MKLIWIAVPALTVALAVSGCKNRKVEPIPPPKAAAWPTKTAIRLPSLAPRATVPGRTEDLHDDVAPDHDRGGMPHGASGISWFQGSFEEAFSIACSCHCYHFGLKH